MPRGKGRFKTGHARRRLTTCHILGARPTPAHPGHPGFAIPPTPSPPTGTEARGVLLRGRRGH
eukprot:8244878-Lingulodinium_polyedra.AAC.1